MGMAASQVRLLQLTSRKNDIGRQLQSLSMEKMSLTREMKSVTKDYQEGLSSKTFKWTTNSGVNYVDLSYNTLMKPNTYNKNTPYLLTNNNGTVIIDDTYKKYAEMISPNGSAGGDYDSKRTEILSELTGIPIEKFESGALANQNATDAANKVNALKEEVYVLQKNATLKLNSNEFYKEVLGNISGFNYSNNSISNNVGDDYSKASDVNVIQWRLGTTPSSAKDRLKELLNQLYTNASNFFGEKDLEAFKEACSSTYTNYSGMIDKSGTDCANVSPVSIEQTNCGGNYCIRVKDFIDSLMGAFMQAGGNVTQNSKNPNIYYYEGFDKSSQEYNDYIAKQEELEIAQEEYNQTIDSNNQVFTSAEESAIKFYDKIFNAIVDNGWEYNGQISDENYLNQMLQNNQYYITSMTENTDEDGNISFEYDSSIASNFTYLISMNDSNAANEALTDYEYKKNIINEKESRIDTRMQNLETEQSAINEMIKGIETVRNDNVERTFSIFS